MAFALAAALAGCATAPAPIASPADRAATCVTRFQYFDLMESLYPNQRRKDEQRVAAPPVEAAGQRVREAGCITMTVDLAGMATAVPPPPSPPGAAIAPISVHAGVVTNMADEANAIAFFQGHGLRARSIGSAPLGRRIYLGRFASQGALDDALALARAAGFASPYPASF